MVDWSELKWLSVHVWLLVMGLIRWIVFSTLVRFNGMFMVITSVVVSWVIRLC